MLLDPTKAHGCDNLSIKNVKICSMSITVPLKIKFEQLLKEGKFLEIWKKKTNVVPINMKEHKGLIKNYHPISLLPIFGEIFERLICNSIFN